MTFGVQMPSKPGFKESGNNTVPVTIKNEDSEFEIVAKCMEAVRKNFGTKVPIT